VQVVVLDLGTSNVRSLAAALAFLGAPHRVTEDPAAIATASHVVLPGVGAWDAAVTALDARGARPALAAHVHVRRRPLLGICLGMQLLFEASDEGTRPGLGLLPGRFRRLTAAPAAGHVVPHARFAPVTGHADSGLFGGLGASPCFYFTHSYALHALDGAPAETTWCRHAESFVAAFARGPLCGAQFHPEKSQGTGLRFLANFLARGAAEVACAA
jgi:glutamine amidotransferase